MKKIVVVVVVSQIGRTNSHIHIYCIFTKQIFFSDLIKWTPSLMQKKMGYKTIFYAIGISHPLGGTFRTTYFMIFPFPFHVLSLSLSLSLCLPLSPHLPSLLSSLFCLTQTITRSLSSLFSRHIPWCLYVPPCWLNLKRRRRWRGRGGSGERTEVEGAIDFKEGWK